MLLLFFGLFHRLYICDIICFIPRTLSFPMPDTAPFELAISTCISSFQGFLERVTSLVGGVLCLEALFLMSD